MPSFKITYEPNFPPRLPFQKELHRLATDLDRLVVEKESITELIDWTLSTVQTIYPGAEVLGPVTDQGGAVIFLGDTGDIIIKPMQS